MYSFFYSTTKQTSHRPVGRWQYRIDSLTGGFSRRL